MKIQKKKDVCFLSTPNVNILLQALETAKEVIAVAVPVPVPVAVAVPVRYNIYSLIIIQYKICMYSKVTD